jgi:hypothetical protein
MRCGVWREVGKSEGSALGRVFARFGISLRAWSSFEYVVRWGVALGVMVEGFVR